MKLFWHLLQHDFRLLLRNQVVAVSAFVTLSYLAIFWGLQYLGAAEKILVLAIFNDPALLGYLFIGVLVLFEKSEGTLDALAVTPFNLHHYLWAKSLSLTSVSIICCIGIVLAGKGVEIGWGHFIMAATICTLVFSFIGFAIVANHRTFNSFLLPTIGILILLGLPFLAYFEVMADFWFYLFPTYPLIGLFDLAFSNTSTGSEIALYYGLSLLWGTLSYYWAYTKMKKEIA